MDEALVNNVRLNVYNNVHIGTVYCITNWIASAHTNTKYRCEISNVGEIMSDACVCVWVLFTVDNFISANRTVFFLVFVYRFFVVLLFFSLPLLLLSHEQYFVSSFATLRRLSVKGTFLIVVVIVVAVVATFCEEHASYSFTCYTYVVCSWSCSMNRIQYFLQNHANVFSLSLC